jgi:hypothetical protein
MSLHSSTEHENTDLRHAGMDSRHPGLQGRVRNIHVNLDSSTPCWNDAIERFCFKPIEALPPRIFKGGREGHEDQITDMATNQKNVFFLRALRVLRGDIQFRLGAALPRCASAVSTPEKAIRLFKEGDL